MLSMWLTKISTSRCASQTSLVAIKERRIIIDR